MLHFDGYGIKDGTQISRDSIIKDGLKNNANIFQINKALNIFNAQLLTNQEALEYIIKDSVNNMTINTPAPQLSDFGLSSSDIEKIGHFKNLYITNFITIIFVSWIFSNCIGINDIRIYTFSLLIYITFGIWYFNFNEKYKINITKLNLYNSVTEYYFVKHNELEENLQRIIKAEKERQRIKEEEERAKRELIERQHLSYWESIINDNSRSTSERGQIFEKEMTKLFKKLGWEVQLTQASRDGGVDIIIKINDEVCLVQCKFYKGKVGVEPVRALWGIKDSYNADRVMMLAYAGTTQGGEDFAAEKNRGRSKEDWVYKICDIHDVIRWYSMAEKR